VSHDIALPRPTANPWRTHGLLLGGLLLILLLLYRQTVLGMAEIWSRNDTFAHGYLVLPLALWMIWRQREAVLAQTPRVLPGMLVPLAILTLLWMLADLVSVNAVAQFAFVGMLICAVPLLLGAAVTRQIMFPLAFLLFAVPFGEFMIGPMMDWTADFVVAALRFSGIPVYREGLFFVIPTGNWSVIDECSGVRYLIASFMVGSLFAYLNYSSRLKRALFMLFALLVPIVANWLRAYIIVMLGHLSDNRLATGVDHLLYGWVFFGIVIFLMFMIGMRWADAAPPQGAAPSTAKADGAGLHGASRLSMLAVTAAAAVLLAWPHGAIGGFERLERGAAAPTLELPQAIAGWEQGERPALEWSPSWRHPRLELHRGYRAGEQAVGLYLAYYRGQHQDSKLVSSLNAVVGMNDRRWNSVGARSGPAAPAALGLPASAYREYDILGPEARPGAAAARAYVVARSFYWIDGRLYGSDVVAKLAMAWSRLSGQLDDGAAIVIYARADDFEQARRRVQAFQAVAVEPLGRALAQAHERR
jgi:exosortase A